MKRDRMLMRKCAQISPDEIAKLLKAFADPTPAYAEGIKVNGEKYTVIMVEDNTIRLKKVSIPSHHPPKYTHVLRRQSVSIKS